MIDWKAIHCVILVTWELSHFQKMFAWILLRVIAKYLISYCHARKMSCQITFPVCGHKNIPGMCKLGNFILKNNILNGWYYMSLITLLKYCSSALDFWTFNLIYVKESYQMIKYFENWKQLSVLLSRCRIEFCRCLGTANAIQNVRLAYIYFFKLQLYTKQICFKLKELHYKIFCY